MTSKLSKLFFPFAKEERHGVATREAVEHGQRFWHVFSQGLGDGVYMYVREGSHCTKGHPNVCDATSAAKVVEFSNQ